MHASKSIRNLIQDETGAMRDLLAGYLDLLILESGEQETWKRRLSVLIEKKAPGQHGGTYAAAKKALDADFEGFSTRDMDITLLCALLIEDMGQKDGPWLPGIFILPEVRSWIYALRDDKNNYLSHETKIDSWQTWKRAISCLSDMERFLDKVERAHGASPEFQSYIKSSRRALDDTESVFRRIYDEERLPSIRDLELRRVAERIMASPDREDAFLDAWERTRMYDLQERERFERLCALLSDMGLSPAMRQLGFFYYEGMFRDGRRLDPDYEAAAFALLSAGVNTLSFNELRMLADIMADPSKRPRRYDGRTANELYDSCTERAPKKQREKFGWPTFNAAPTSDSLSNSH